MLQPGDFVDCLVEMLVMPMTVDDYYGPNENLRADLSINANTWKPIFRQAVGNNLRLTVSRGRLIQPYPISLAVNVDETAEIEITGGPGYVPITFAGLSNYKEYELWQEIGGKRQQMVQSVFGNDFWQTDFDPVTGKYRMTYNILLDSPGDIPGVVRLLFKPVS